MEKDDYSFNIIHEAVASSDQFPDQTHQKVADSIFELMQSSNKAITIGLEGGWGSGKSTVVKLLSDKLGESPDNTLIFLFDAWAHEGDPLRRIFLESLILEIQPYGHNANLEALKKKISGREKTVEVKSKRTTSALGGILSVAAFFVPLGASLLASVDFTTLTAPKLGAPFHFQFWLGLLAVTLPLWALIGWRFCGSSQNSEQKQQGLMRLLLGSKKWDIFATEATEDYTQDITEDGERTSVEFEDFFKQIMDLTIGPDKTFDRALIVIDNLDRVNAEQALSIWSVLQTFFQNRNERGKLSSDEWQTKLWFLVPYDRDGLQKVWSTNHPARTTTQETSGTFANNALAESENGVISLALSSLEKCFQVIAEVPEPIMSAWADFLEKNADAALVGWPQDERKKIIDTFTVYESKMDRSPSPRQIRSFINRVGLLGLRWRNIMSAEAIALYACFRRTMSSRALRQNLILNTVSSPPVMTESVKREIAGMLFGVEARKGMQLLLRPEINTALGKGDAKMLTSLIATHQEGFWVVWEGIKSSELPNGHTEEFLINATIAFCSAAIECNEQKRVQSTIGSLQNEWRKQKGKWDFTSYDYSPAISALLEAIEEPKSFISFLEVEVNEAVVAATKSITDEADENASLRNILIMVDLLKSKNVSFVPKSYPALGKELWQYWVRVLEEIDEDCPFVLPSKNAVTNIAGLIAVDNPAPEILRVLDKTMDLVPKDGGWIAVLNKLIEWLKNPNATPTNEAAYLLLCKLIVKLGYKDKVSDAFNSPENLEKLKAVDAKNMPGLLTLTALVLESDLLKKKVSPSITDFWKSEYVAEPPSAALMLIDSLNCWSIFFQLAKDSNNAVSIGAIRDPELAGKLFEIPDANYWIDEYYWANSEDLNYMIGNLITHGGLVSAKEIIVEQPISYKKYLVLIKQFGGDVGSALVSESIRKVQASEWRDQLSKDSVLFECLGNEGVHEFKDGITSLIRDELGTGNLSQFFWGDMNAYLAKTLDRDDVEKILTEEYFEQEVDHFEDSVFEQFKTIGSSHVSNVDDKALMLRLQSWVKSEQWDRISWIVGVGFDIGSSIKEALIDCMTERFQELTAKSEDATAEYGLQILTSLAENLKIKLVSDEPPEDAEVSGNAVEEAGKE